MQRYRYSMSCFLMYLGVSRRYEHLRHHTIFMPDDYRGLIRNIIDGHGLPGDLALSLATLFLWLIVALTAATFQALWNRDDLYGVGPFVKPSATLMKKRAH